MPMDAPIGARIADARSRAGLNRNQLARALGTSWQHVDHWEKGRTRPTLASVRRLAELLGVSVDYLLGLRGTPELASSSSVERFLRELAPPDLTADEEQWLRSAPIDDAAAAPSDYLALLERLRGVGQVATPRSGTRRKVDPTQLAEEIRRRKDAG
jgi:transcriptional regulator with XRE-family HTH domain